MNRWHRTLLATLVLAATGAPSVAQTDEEARLEQLERWQESPLDLRRADVAEIGLLPGLDPDLAEAVVGLRDAGGLDRLEDLVRVPGLGAADLDALRPYVRLGRRSPAGGVELDLVAQRRDPDATRWRQATHLESGPLSADFIALRSGGSVRRGAGRLDLGGRFSVAGGELVLNGPADLFAAVPSRSRVAAAPRPRDPAIRARTDSGSEPGWSGAAIVDERRGVVFAGRGPSGRTALAVAVGGRHAGLAFGLAARHGEGPLALGGYLSREAGRTVTWVGFATEPGVRSGHFGLRLAGSGWRFGVDASAVDGPLSRGSDPVSGYRLDREQRAMQVHGRLRGHDWSAGFVARELRRGAVAQASAPATLDLDLVWRPRARPGPERLEFGLRATPERRVTLVARFAPGPVSVRVRFSRQTDGAESAEIFGVDVERRVGPGRLLIAGAAVDGDASRVWSLRRPGTGIHPVWLRPGELATATGFGFDRAGLRLGVWAWVRGGARRPPETGFGLACRIRAGRLVQRLH